MSTFVPHKITKLILYDELQVVEVCPTWTSITHGKSLYWKSFVVNLQPFRYYYSRNTYIYSFTWNGPRKYVFVDEIPPPFSPFIFGTFRTYPFHLFDPVRCWKKNEKNTFLYLIKKYAVEYKWIYFIHVR